MDPAPDGYPLTYYSATLGTTTRWPSLTGPHEVEVCVVGGGLAGIATALALAERGVSVAVLESRRIGWGASGRNGGLVSPGYGLPMPALAKRLGREPALALWRLSKEAVELVRQRAGTLGPGTLLGAGGLVCRMKGHPDRLLDHVRLMNETFGADLKYLPSAELRRDVLTDSYADGYVDPLSFVVHPLNLLRGMAERAAGLGARIHEGVPVRAIRRQGGLRIVLTDRAALRARHVVLCGGAYLGLLHRRLGTAIVPVASFVMVTERAPDRIREAIRTEAGVSDTRVVPDYYHVLPDGRLLWGGRAAAFEPSPERIKQRLRPDMTRTYKQIAGLEIEMAWSGMMPFARHQMPIIAKISEGLWAASGFGGQGLASTTLAGTLIASAIADGDDRYRYFVPFGTSFAGGPRLGRMALPPIILYYRLGDYAASALRRFCASLS